MYLSSGSPETTSMIRPSTSTATLYSHTSPGWCASGSLERPVLVGPALAYKGVVHDKRQMLLRRRGTDGLLTHRWRRQSGANPSRKPGNSLLAGKIQGNSSILASDI